MPFSRFLDRLNTEHRAAIESDRLLTQLMAWRSAMQPEPPKEPVQQVTAEAPETRERRPARSGTAPRLGEIPAAKEQPKADGGLIDRVRAFKGRLIDLFG